MLDDIYAAPEFTKPRVADPIKLRIPQPKINPDVTNQAPAQNQAWPTRAPIMEGFFKVLFGNQPIKGMEIGVWYGKGSTKIWLENCVANSEFWLVDTWRPFSTKEDLNEDNGHNFAGMDQLSTDAFLSAFLAVKQIEQSRHKDNLKINLLRGDSSNCLSTFKSDSFDFIYIDGDHHYEKVKTDLIEAKRLIKKNNALICGDDLEKLPTDELYELALKNLNRDSLRHPNPKFHPGVLAAIKEEFEQVHMLNGFWWIAYRNGRPDFEFCSPTFERA